MNYNWSFQYIPKNKVQCIFELGARDCEDSITLHKYFNCPVVAFECNPDCLSECKKTLSGLNYPIYLIEKAVHEENKIVEFRPFIRSKYDNMGASSLFEIDFISSRPTTDPGYGMKDVQNVIEVEAIRLDKYITETGHQPDLICMDIQEAELIALKGLGESIKKVKFIVFEASNVSTYKGGCNFSDVHEYLVNNNFRFISSTNADIDFFKNPTGFFNFFDCLYVNNLYI